MKVIFNERFISNDLVLFWVYVTVIILIIGITIYLGIKENKKK
jgi:hypothetical protein